MLAQQSDFSSNVHSHSPNVQEFRVPIRYPRVCFQYGDLAILTGRHYFLVHQETVCRQSTVLASLIETLQSSCEKTAIDGHSLEGRPILHLQDTSDEMALFLGALLNGIPPLHYGWADFSLVSSLLRLSTKYSVSPLRAELIAGFSVGYPTTLVGWDERERRLCCQESSYALPHPILVLQLAKEINSPELMIPALYDLSRNVLSHVAAGVRSLGANPTLHKPSHEELFFILKGRELGCRFLSTFIVTELEGRKLHEECTQRRLCQMSFEFVTFDLLRDINGLLCNRNSDALFAISECLSMVAEGRRGSIRPRVCALCLGDFNSVVDRARNEIWYSLPDWFGVAIDAWG